MPNVAPAVEAGVALAADEGSPVPIVASFRDFGGGDAVAATIDWGDGTIEAGLVAAEGGPLGVSGTVLGIHPYADDGLYTVEVTVVDADGAAATARTSVRVNNVAPDSAAIDAGVSDRVFSVGVAMPFTAGFADIGSLDTHTALWTIEHKNHLLGSIVTESRAGTVDPVTRTVSDSLAFSEAGLYRVTVTITDDDSGAMTSGESTFVIYDPAAGFVTGGGWITSPAGAYAARPSWTGKASFGFVSQYHKGVELPMGQTEFQAGDLNFHSTGYDWMVVSGAWVQVRGTGTINGGGRYGFLLTMIDGPDTLRMKIWDTNRGDAVVFDLQPNAGDEADPTTPLRGGQITLRGGATDTGTGKSNGTGRKLTAGESPQASGTTVFSLTDQALAPIVAEAMRRWSDSSLLDEHSLGLGEVTFEIADLEGLTLGEVIGSMVWLDVSAAGAGWFVDTTPRDDVEFGLVGGGAGLLAMPTSAASGRMDLLSVVLHELGHVLGYEHGLEAHSVMSATLDAGERFLPGAAVTPVEAASRSLLSGGRGQGTGRDGGSRIPGDALSTVGLPDDSTPTRGGRPAPLFGWHRREGEILEPIASGLQGGVGRLIDWSESEWPPERTEPVGVGAGLERSLPPWLRSFLLELGEEEVVLVFGTNQAWERGQAEVRVELSHRIILSPFAAKRLADLLTNVMRDYETRFGPLDV
jgi:hypothetical protein